jgi:hypothetical protein
MVPQPFEQIPADATPARSRQFSSTVVASNGNSHHVSDLPVIRMAAAE